jgi:hypothetical protein
MSVMDFFDEHSPKDPHATHMPVAVRLGYKRFYFCYDPTHAKHILQDQRHKYSLKPCQVHRG